MRRRVPMVRLVVRLDPAARAPEPADPALSAGRPSVDRPRPVVLRRIALEPLVLGAALLLLAIPDRLVLYGLLTWK